MYDDCRKVEKIRHVMVAIALMIAPVIALAAEETDSSRTPVTINLVYENNHNPPYALGRGTSIDWNKPGHTLELLKMVGEQIGVEFTFRRMPWKRGLYLLEKNEIDGIFHASYKPAREKVGVYPKKANKPDENRAIFFQTYVLYKLRNSPLYYDGENIIALNGMIGANSGYSIAEDLRNKGYAVEESSSQKKNFDLLNKGEIAMYAMLESMADDYLKRNSDRYPNIVKVDTALKSKAYYLLFSHKFVQQNPELAEKIWNVIVDIKASDAFNTINDKY